MSEDAARMPSYDPESQGLPDTYDPDSSAYDELDSVRESDGPDPVDWPDRRPSAADRFGTTRHEAIEGEPLDMRLAEEEPDVGEDEEWPEDRLRAELVDPDNQGVFGLDTEDPGESVGRLTDPDDNGSQGRHNETVAADAGMAGGGATAEESAMHLVDDEDMNIEDDFDLDS